MEKFEATPQIARETEQAHELLMACHVAIDNMAGAMRGISHNLDIIGQLLPVSSEGVWKSHQARLDNIADSLKGHAEARDDILRAGHSLTSLGLAMNQTPAVELKVREGSATTV